MMDGGCNLRQGMARMRGGQWASAQCVQKVEEMLSRAILHQEDLWGMLMIHSPEGASLDAHTGHMNTADAISPPVLRALKAKLENSMDWCHLALCRLKEIVLHTSPTPPHLSLGVAGGAGVMSQYPKGEAKLVNSSPMLNTPSPLSPLRVPLRKETLSPHPFTGPPNSAGRSGGVWSPMSILFNEAAQLPAVAQTGEEDAPPPQPQPMGIPGADGDHQQGQNFTKMSNLGMVSDWSMLAEATVSNLPPPPLLSAAATDPHQSSSSCPMNLEGSHNGGSAAEFKDLADTEDGSYVTKAVGREPRPRSSGQKRDREPSADDSKLAVVFQQLKPGIDTKKGIPDDGHRGWKKYGNKTIQNSNFCRGYYKCSVKECRAKKMVQPTDKDPSIFEVTYVGKHTCSSTLPRRNRSRTGGAAPPSQAEAQEAERPFGSGGGGAAEDAGGATLDVPTASTVTKEGDAGGRPWSTVPGTGRGSEVDEGSRVTRSSEGSQEDDEMGRGVRDWAPLARPESDAADQDGGSTYLHESSRHHQEVYAFQDPLLW